MSEDTAARVIETETVINEVKVETPKPKRGRRFLNWLNKVAASLGNTVKKVGSKLKSAAVKSGEVIKTAATTAVSWAKKAAAGTGKGLAWTWTNVIARPGIWVGKTAAHTAAFLGRSGWTLLKATPRFAGRAFGWGTRLLSDAFRAAFNMVWRMSWAMFIATAVVMFFTSFVNDKYEQAHQYPVAWSRGTTTVPKPEGEGAARAASTYAAERVADRYAGRTPAPGTEEPGDIKVTETTTTETVTTVPEEAGPSTTETVTETVEPKPFSISELTNELLLNQWFKRSEKLDIPLEASDTVVSAALESLTQIHSGFIVGIGSEQHKISIVETERGKKLSDNAIFQGASYWQGRDLAFQVAHTMREIDQSQPWHNIEVEWSNKTKMEWAMIEKKLEPSFESREFHRQSVRQGYDHQMKWELARFKLEWDKNPYVETKKTTAAKKTAAKKSTTRA